MKLTLDHGFHSVSLELPGMFGQYFNGLVHVHTFRHQTGQMILGLSTRPQHSAEINPILLPRLRIPAWQSSQGMAEGQQAGYSCTLHSRPPPVTKNQHP